MSRPRILLTGATGYIGGRLLRRLEEGGRPVRCLVRALVDGLTNATIVPSGTLATSSGDGAAGAASGWAARDARFPTAGRRLTGSHP